MNLLKAAPAVLCAAIIAMAFSPSVKADDWNRKTVVTFSQPVETPGVHMQGMGRVASRHLCFQSLGSKSDRHIVQIFNQDETDALRHRPGHPELSAAGQPAKPC